jgi:hypothetical protein
LDGTSAPRIRLHLEGEEQPGANADDIGDAGLLEGAAANPEQPAVKRRLERSPDPALQSAFALRCHLTLYPVVLKVE